MYALCHQYLGPYIVLLLSKSASPLSLGVSVSRHFVLLYIIIILAPSTPPTPLLSLGHDHTFTASLYPTDERFGPIRYTILLPT